MLPTSKLWLVGEDVFCKTMTADIKYLLFEATVDHGATKKQKKKKKKSKLQKNNLNFNNFEGSSLSQCHSHICQHSSHNTQLIICIFQMCLLKLKKKKKSDIYSHVFCQYYKNVQLHLLGFVL